MPVAQMDVVPLPRRHLWAYPITSLSALDRFGRASMSMSAHRRSSRQSDPYEDSSQVPNELLMAVDSDIEFAPTVTPNTYQNQAECSLPGPGMFSFAQDELSPRRTVHSRKKPVNYIPRPPNAFILFRSSFIKSQRVSTGVETNHSTLSKIIGLTWQRLSDEERQKWHARAKIVQDEHKRKFPEYSFRPIHNKSKVPSGERRKLREVEPKDHERCAKIAELLAHGKKGHELEEAIQEFDRHHVPEIVTRFETPITANTFSSSSSGSTVERSSPTPKRRSSAAAANVPQYGANFAASSFSPSLPTQEQQEVSTTPSSIPSFDTNSFFSNPTPSFEYDTFAFSIDHPTPTLPEDGLTPVVTPSAPSFNIQSSHDTSRLCGDPQYMEDWARSCSPLSNSTTSMPTTPAHITVPFPDQQAYGIFAPEPASDYTPLDGAYGGFSHYSSYTPMPEQRYGEKELSNLPSGSGFVASGPEETRARTVREDLDFSLFMASLPPYSL